jgi:hypothetical protein
MSDQGIGEELPESLELSAEGANNPPENPWTLKAHSKRILKGWLELCNALPENAARCYGWLRADPMRRITGRCYPLRHKGYAGAWAYEIGSGHRVYYVPKEDSRQVLVYYAGPHPPKVPCPPAT